MPTQIVPRIIQSNPKEPMKTITQILEERDEESEMQPQQLSQRYKKKRNIDKIINEKSDSDEELPQSQSQKRQKVEKAKPKRKFK